MIDLLRTWPEWLQVGLVSAYFSTLFAFVVLLQRAMPDILQSIAYAIEEAEEAHKVPVLRLEPRINSRLIMMTGTQRLPGHWEMKRSKDSVWVETFMEPELAAAFYENLELVQVTLWREVRGKPVPLGRYRVMGISMGQKEVGADFRISIELKDTAHL